MPYRPTQRTEARRLETRERVMAAAHRLIAGGGFRAASIAAVAREAGVATGSVYRHFPSKAELFSVAFRRASQREVDAMRAAVRAPVDGEGAAAAERLAAAIDAFARRALRAPRLAYALLAEPVDPAVEAERLVFRRAYAEVFATVLEEGVESGELLAQDAGLTAAALVGAIGEALVGPLAPSEHEACDPDQLIASLVALSLRAAGAPVAQPA